MSFEPCETSSSDYRRSQQDYGHNTREESDAHAIACHCEPRYDQAGHGQAQNYGCHGDKVGRR